MTELSRRVILRESSTIVYLFCMLGIAYY